MSLISIESGPQGLSAEFSAKNTPSLNFLPHWMGGPSKKLPSVKRTKSLTLAPIQLNMSRSCGFDIDGNYIGSFEDIPSFVPNNYFYELDESPDEHHSYMSFEGSPNFNEYDFPYALNIGFVDNLVEDNFDEDDFHEDDFDEDDGFKCEQTKLNGETCDNIVLTKGDVCISCHNEYESVYTEEMEDVRHRNNRCDGKD